MDILPPESLHQQIRQLIGNAKAEKKKLARKLEKQSEELKDASNWELNKQIGDSILASQSEIKKGMTEAPLTNLHTGTIEIIKLNPKCDAVKNAELFFKKASKGKRGFEICQEQCSQTKKELTTLDLQIQALTPLLALPDNSSELAEAFDNLDHGQAQKSGVTQQKVQGKGQHEQKIPFRHYTIEGFDIYLGKNSTQNDELSIRFAKPRDIWMHVAGHPGSHCIIRMKKDAPPPPKHILEAAAGFCVWFSNAKHTSYAEVHVTEARFVHKRRKAPAGEVIAERCKAIRTAPISPQVFFKNDSIED